MIDACDLRPSSLMDTRIKPAHDHLPIMAKDTTGRAARHRQSGGRLKLSSKLWLERQLNDPDVAKAKRDGLRSRAAYKLIEIDDKHHFLKRGVTVVDLALRRAAGARSPPSASARPMARARSSPSICWNAGNSRRHLCAA